MVPKSKWFAGVFIFNSGGRDGPPIPVDSIWLCKMLGIPPEVVVGSLAVSSPSSPSWPSSSSSSSRSRLSSSLPGYYEMINQENILIHN